MSQKLRILVIGDSEDDTQLVLRELRLGNYEVEFERVETAERIQSALAQNMWDLILCDYTLPKLNALQALDLLKASGLDLPFIIIADTVDEESAVTALKAGADDFLVKGKLARLIPAIERAVQDAKARRERKLALEALRESETRYRILFESNPHPMWVYDIETLKFLAVNDAAVEHYGYLHDEFLSMTIEDIRPVEDVAALRATLVEFQQSLHTPAVWRHRKKDGTLIDVEISSHSLEWAGRPTRLVLANDITARIRTEQALRQRELEFKSLADNMPDIVARFDQQLRHVYVNEVIEKISGIPAKAFIGKTNQELSMPERQVVLWDQQLRHIFTSGQPGSLEFDFASPTGLRYFESRLVPEFGPAGRVENVLSIVRDITERKQAEEALRESEEKIQNIILHSRSMFYAHTLDHVLTYVSPQSRDILGCAPEEAMVQWQEFLSDHPSNRRGVKATERAIETGERQPPYELELITRKGRKIWVQVDESPVVKDGKTVAIVGSVTDITERKQAELRIQHLTQLYAILSQVNQAIVRVKDRDELFNAICRVIVDYGKFGLAWIGLLDPETGEMTAITVQSAVQVEFPFQTINVNESPFKNGLIGSAVEKARVVYSKDIQEDPNMGHWRELAAAGDFHAAAAVPFRFGGEVFGLLNLYATDADFFTGEEMNNLLEEISQDISFALDTIELHSRRTQAEEALRKSEKQYRAIVEHTIVGVYRTTLGGDILYVNEALARILEFETPDELITQGVIARYADPKDREFMLNTLREEGHISAMDVKLLTRTGKVRNVLLSATMDGEILTGMISDITERKQAEEAFWQTSRLLQSIVGAAPLAIVTYDVDGLVRSWNAAATRIFGWDEQEVIGQLPPYVPPKALAEFHALRAQTIQGKSLTGIELRRQRKDGPLVDINLNTAPLYDHTGQISGYIAIIEDITERKRAQEALREKERLLTESQRIGNIGSWSYDILKDSLQYSDEMYRLVDVSPEEFGHSSEAFLELIYSSDRRTVAKWMEEIRAGRQASEIEFPIFRKNGEMRYIRCRGAVEFDISGTPIRFIGTAQDVTERKLAELQIRQQIERLTALREIDQAISSSFDLVVTLNIFLSHLVAQLHVDAADVLLIELDGQTLSYIAGQGFRTNAIESGLLRLTDSQAMRERRPIHVESLENKPDPRLLTTLGISESFVSYLGVPLLVKGKIKGVLEIFHRAPLHPYGEWLDFLNTLSGQAAIAIENATLFENLARSNRELSQAYDATIVGWSRALDLRDKETEGHTQRVTEMMLELARAFGLPEQELLYVRWGALLHDIGKMGVPDNILLKPGNLTEEEWVHMKSHPQYAYDLLKPITFLAPALDIPYCHHEKWDGTGYPRGLKREEIPLIARLFAVVDTWDALCSDRPYRKAWSPEQAKEYILSQAGSHFDPRVVERFLEILEE